MNNLWIINMLIIHIQIYIKLKYKIDNYKYINKINIIIIYINLFLLIYYIIDI